MNQRNTFYKIDKRTPSDILKDISSLSKAYTPEWLFDTKNADTGSVMAMIYANQLNQNINRLNLAMDKYRTEFANMIGVSLKPSSPAKGYATLGLIQDSIFGVAIPKNTKLLADNGRDEMSVFQTEGNLFVTNSRITSILSVSKSQGKIIPLFGETTPIKIVDGYAFDEEGEQIIDEEEEENDFIANDGYNLFDYSADGIEKNCVVFYHTHIFDTASSSVLQIKIDVDESEKLDILYNKDFFSWQYYTNDGFVEFEKIERKNNILELTKEGEIAYIKYDNKEQNCILIEAKKPIPQPIVVNSISFSSVGEFDKPEYIIHNDVSEENEDCLPFGETASMYDECYISNEKILGQKGANITIKFDLSYVEKLVTFSEEEQKFALKPIMRKPTKEERNPANSSVQRVSFEYFNGIGWAKLKTAEDLSTIFSGDIQGEVKVEFICPNDIMPYLIASGESTCIRMRIIQADNCYLQPCKHNMPRLKNIVLSYTYGEIYVAANKTVKISGCDKSDITFLLAVGKPVCIFEPLKFDKNSMLLGFNKPMINGPISIYFSIEENIFFDTPTVTFEYYTRSGFKQLRVIDYTNNFRHSGTVAFMPPSDMATVNIAGNNCYWIKLTDEKSAYDVPQPYCIRINYILPNTIQVINLETKPIELYYIDSVTADMSFKLPNKNIYSAEVFVNELSTMTPENMSKMLAENPEDIRIEFDSDNNITEFFVNWTEVQNFDFSTIEDRHYILNRMNNTIYFGDGVNARIPQIQNGVAFTVQATCCDGSAGNVDIGTISISQNNISYVGDIFNSAPTYGGSDIESVNSALERASSMFSSKNRLVSELDYERAVRAISPNICKIKCVCGISPDGKIDYHDTVIAVMMTEHQTTGAFNDTKVSIKKQLIENCEMTLEPNNLHIIEPIFIKLSVNVWVSTADIDNTFEIQSAIINRISTYVDPILGGYNREGWDIGSLPTEEQISMIIRSIQKDFLIDKIVMSLKYRDANGKLQTSFEQIKDNPFVIAVNDEHNVMVALYE